MKTEIDELNSDERVGLMVVGADRLITFVRRAFPHIGMYGKTHKGDADKLVKALSNEKLMGWISYKLFQNDSAYSSKVKPLYDKINEIQTKQNAAEKILTDEFIKRFEQTEKETK